MKIENIIEDILFEEEIKNKKLFRTLAEKWKTQCPELSIDDMVKIFNRHDAIKNTITDNVPAVISFLRRYDGEHGTKKYTIQNLKDITSIDLDHLVEFLTEFGRFYIDYPCAKTGDSKKEQNAQIKRIFSENGNKKTPEKIELSKKMWYDQSTAIINVNGFRVYPIFNQEQAIRMGYYYQTIHKKNYIEKNGVGINAPWCVTWRGSDVEEYKEDENGKSYGPPLFTHHSNMYGTYRNIHHRTFYFIIDENKPQSDKYYMSALQIEKRGSYVLTSSFNDNDKGVNWDEVVSIYPEIKDYKKLITYRDMDQDELESISITDRINEIPGSPNEFARQTQNIKDEYISNGGIITKVLSWKSMNNDLKTKYIDLMSGADVSSRLSSYDLVHEVLVTPGFDKKLKRRLDIVGFQGGLVTIFNNLFKTEFSLIRKSIDKPHIGIYEKRGTGEYGLLNLNTLSWVVYKGTTYNATFKIKDYSTIFDEDGSTYYVEQLLQDGTGKMVYLVTPLDKGNGIDTYIISQNTWEQIKGKFTNVDKFSSTSKDFEPEKHSDIEEKKGI